MAVYGHRILSLYFKPIVEIVEDGFIFRRTKYSWSDVASVEKMGGDYIWMNTGLLNYPNAVVTLKDGAKIKFVGRVLEEQGVKPVIDPMEAKSDAYDYVLARFVLAEQDNT